MAAGAFHHDSDSDSGDPSGGVDGVLVLAAYRLRVIESGTITKAANVPRAGPFNARVARLCTRRPPLLICTPRRIFARRDFLDNALVER
jgi:hypothetical protein